MNKTQIQQKIKSTEKIIEKNISAYEKISRYQQKLFKQKNKLLNDLSAIKVGDKVQIIKVTVRLKNKEADLSDLGEKGKVIKIYRDRGIIGNGFDIKFIDDPEGCCSFIPKDNVEKIHKF